MVEAIRRQLLSPFAKQRTKKIVEELDWGSIELHLNAGLDDSIFVIFCRVSHDQQRVLIELSNRK